MLHLKKAIDNRDKRFSGSGWLRIVNKSHSIHRECVDESEKDSHQRSRLSAKIKFLLLVVDISKVHKSDINPRTISALLEIKAGIIKSYRKISYYLLL